MTPGFTWFKVGDARLKPIYISDAFFVSLVILLEKVYQSDDGFGGASCLSVLLRSQLLVVVISFSIIAWLLTGLLFIVVT